MTDQYIYLSIMAVVILILILSSKEPLKMLLGLTVVTTAWQGGLWLGYFENDAVLANFLYLFFVIYLAVRDHREPLKKRFVPHIIIPALLIMVGMWISAQGARNMASARGGAFIAIERLLIFITLAFLIRKPKDLKYVLWGLVICVLFQSVLAFLQFWDMRFAIGVIDDSQSFQRWRSNGTFFHANSLGLFYVMTIPMVLRVVLMLLPTNKRKMKYWAVGTLILAFGGLYFTQNRGGWIGLTAGLLSVLGVEMLIRKTRITRSIGKLIPIFLILLPIFMLRFGATFTERMFGAEFDQQYDQRKMLEDQAKELIRQYPVFGVGHYNYRQHISFEFTHNLYLLITSEAGYFGLVAFLLFLMGWFFEIVKGVFSKNIIVRNLSFGIGSSFVGFVLASIPGPDYSVMRQVGDYTWILAGLMVGINRIDRRYSFAALPVIAKKNKLKEEEVKRLNQYLKDQWSGFLG